ncbi:methyl-accepting chemotaxis protein [Desulfitobacterium sp. AusDCA]|uniref:methyl-accepting chemotaxis protein n=1 Tax=Desulfitobacterium sp. AusDCA TaxID=3240383 RepID=UPI003DA76A19
MISIDQASGLKDFAEIQAKAGHNRPLYIMTEGDQIIWKNNSDVFDIEDLKIGSTVRSDSVTNKAISQKEVLTEKLPRAVFGMRVLVNSIPIINEASDAVGTFTVIYPLLHPIAAAFANFAPILAEMFPEGVLMYCTDMKKYQNRQSSKIFDLPDIQIGNELTENDLAFNTIETKQITIKELDASIYGIPTLGVNYPLYDDEHEVVGTFGIFIPKEIAIELRDMSENMDNGLNGISAAIEQLAASATQIHENEQVLNKEINGIITLTGKINKISEIIKEIADETKMLGLNAAIEAARAGEAGRGFGVVAEEIRKLSEQSKSTVPQIKELTENIKIDVDKVIEKSNGSLNSSQEQAAASEEITASIEEITSMAGELRKIAKQL